MRRIQAPSQRWKGLFGKTHSFWSLDKLGVKASMQVPREFSPALDKLEELYTNKQPLQFLSDQPPCFSNNLVVHMKGLNRCAALLIYPWGALPTLPQIRNNLILPNLRYDGDLCVTLNMLHNLEGGFPPS